MSERLQELTAFVRAGETGQLLRASPLPRLPLAPPTSPGTTAFPARVSPAEPAGVSRAGDEGGLLISQSSGRLSNTP